MSRLRMVLGNGSLARYPEGGGHWAVRLQYLFGLRGLGHDVFWLELLEASGDRARDRYLIDTFSKRLRRYGFEGQFAVLLLERRRAEQSLESASIHGYPASKLRGLLTGCDLLWNFCCSLRDPLLSLFRHKVLIDLDPGVIHLSEAGHSLDLGIARHDALLTVGLNIDGRDCEVPKLGMNWRPFAPFVYLPMWRPAPDPGPTAPFTSVTHWEWEQLSLGRRVFVKSKRDAYLRYLSLPGLAGRRFELAANIAPGDASDDRELLGRHGWWLVDPNRVTRLPSLYRGYIRASRAELSCPKPIYRELRTGWFSDRSAAYLASGRPVLAEETGFERYLPTGTGLLTFTNLAEASEGVRRIDADYARHSRAARAMAEEHLDSKRRLAMMIDASA